MKTTAIFTILASLAMISFRSDKPAYVLYDSEGKNVRYAKMIESISSADVIFFGELHDNPIAHWLELEITADLYKTAGNNLVMGAEMFETDNQLLLDEYLAKDYEADKFEAEAKLWKNYKTDYKPLVEFARKNGLPFIATNIPRRYASMVSRKGFEVLDSLSGEAKQLIAPLPIAYDPEVKCYKDMMDMHDMPAPGPGMPSMPGMAASPNENLPKAQAIKDATMAHFILQNFAPGKKFIHYNGSYHSDNHLGIIYYLKLYKPDIKVATVTTVIQADPDSLFTENKGLADFIIAVPETMTHTY
jgi:uncharacterized iron-regulated protein